ncbi:MULTISPECIES: hypothetical protein [Streptomyces]|uniref:hypothetical protein n=1 Tax=Streptomyces TaxID=1883 RepID=UPI00163C97E2|nr:MULTISPECIES: hypothetical protein [Streptomyces]MBC2879224.1 hypothetical protein [Streptomyces sp. TYQ1024]UBI39804.1 hypothetical protein K7I03_27240 [Streptomyces mobaraensis]UKW32385.1 hypothetical protein MCU78_27175 [Streptomyces sp. TYQ1024]
MTEPAITAEERLSRLRARMPGERADTRAGRRMRLSRAGNTLVGAGPHAAARQDAGHELTDLERALLEIRAA